MLESSSVGTEAAILVRQLTLPMRPSTGDGGPFGRVERRFHPKGGNVPQIGLPEWFAETESSRNRLLISSASLSGRVRALLDMMGHGAPSAGILSGYARVFAVLRKLLSAFTLKYAWD